MRRAVLTAGLCLTSLNALAQGPSGAISLTPAAVADSQKVIQALFTRLHSKPDDAAAWYRMGMIEWALADRTLIPGSGLSQSRAELLRMADSGLSAATSFAPKTPVYQLWLGKLMLSTGNPGIRLAAASHFNSAVEQARKGTDSSLWSEAAVEAGRVYWRRFDSARDRRLTTSHVDLAHTIHDLSRPQDNIPLGPSCDQSCIDRLSMMPALPLKDIISNLKSSTMPVAADANGAIEYEQAGTLFREAYRVAPTNARAFRAVAMWLADSSRWQELTSLARAHVARIPWDANAWLALGLARHRLGDTKFAAAAFDTAFSYLAPAERARLDRLERVLNPGDTTRPRGAAANAREATSDMYWRYADPLWSRAGNETRVEFLARVTYAELRWTVDELGVRGADTDRGDVYVRYGRPDITIAAQRTAVSEQGAVGSSADIATYWIYNSGLLFSFSGMPSYATSRTPNVDLRMATAMKEEVPVRWDNLAKETIDSMPVQVARFRGGADSVDVLVATLAPYAEIAAASDVKEPVQNAFWLLKDGTVLVAHDSVAMTAAGTSAWTHRVAPGQYVYRAEASASGSTRAARYTAEVRTDASEASGFSPKGFGLSDILTATAADQPVRGGRWTALHATPMIGALSSAASFSLVWENYDFAQKDNVAQYGVVITLARERGAVSRIAASVVGALASVARVDRRDDRVVISLDRTAPWSSAFADQIQIALSDTPAGSYLLTLDVTDKVSGQKATRTTNVIVR